MSAVPSTSDADPGLSAGQLLRRAREAAGLHVAALAVALKVPVRKLEALEGDRHDLLPDAVFARALASTVCRTLKIDAAPVLARLPQSGAPRLVRADGGLNAPFRAPGDALAPGWREHLLRPAPLLVGALLVGALAILLLPSSQPGADLATAAVPDAVSAAVMQPPTVVPPLGPGVPQLAPAQSLVPEPAGGPGTPQVAAAPLAAATAAAPGPVAPIAAQAPVPATPPAQASGLIVFRVTAPSWIEVTDSKGVVALRRTLLAGEFAGASGALPLAVTVGSAAATVVEVRGKRFDLGPVSRDNVARFEVK